MRRLWVLLIFGCGQPYKADLTPSGTYTLFQTAQSCTPELPETSELTITGTQVWIGQYEATNTVVESLGTRTAPANVRASISWSEYIGIVDGVPTTITVQVDYELWGDELGLVGTAGYAVPSYGHPCVHTVDANRS